MSRDAPRKPQGFFIFTTMSIKKIEVLINKYKELRESEGRLKSLAKNLINRDEQIISLSLKTKKQDSKVDVFDSHGFLKKEFGGNEESSGGFSMFSFSSCNQVTNHNNTLELVLSERNYLEFISFTLAKTSAELELVVNELKKLGVKTSGNGKG